MELVAGLAKASGIDGMVLGQALDIAAETAGRSLTLNEITALQAGKTGALIGFAAEAGAVTVVISGAETGAGYALSVSSAGGGAAVTRTGTIAAAETVLSDLDLTGLGDGALTASLVLTDAAGNPAGAVTASHWSTMQPPM